MVCCICSSVWKNEPGERLRIPSGNKECFPLCFSQVSVFKPPRFLKPWRFGSIKNGKKQADVSCGHTLWELFSKAKSNEKAFCLEIKTVCVAECRHFCFSRRYHLKVAPTASAEAPSANCPSTNRPRAQSTKGKPWKGAAPR